eukprot:gene8115-1362_t
MSALINRSSQLSANGHRNCRCSACMPGSKAFAAKPMVRRAPRSSTIMAAAPPTDKLQGLLKNNRKWAADQAKADPEYFSRLKDMQAPEYLWIGCADSRVPANTILGLNPGEIFVQRNVGNQASHRDMNCMSCIEFSVTALGVSTIIVCGHYKCGAVKAALTLPSKTPGLTNCWIADIREARNQNMKSLVGLSDEKQVEKLCEYNVLRQVYHVCTCPTVQQWWDEGKEMNVYGVVYSLEDGLLKQLAGPITSNATLGTSNQEEFVQESVKKQEEGVFGVFKSLFGEKEKPVVAAPKPAGPKLTEVEENTINIGDKLAAHASWDEGKN